MTELSAPSLPYAVSWNQVLVIAVTRSSYGIEFHKYSGLLLSVVYPMANAAHRVTSPEVINNCNHQLWSLIGSLFKDILPISEVISVE
jgi:hypothetical protein